MKPIFSVIITLMAACQETNLTGIDKYAPPTEDTSLAPEELVVTDEPEVIEECPDRVYSAIQLSTDEECKMEPPVIQYTPIIEWSMSDFVEFPSLREAQSAPVVVTVDR